MAITPVPSMTPVPTFPALSERAAGTYNSSAYAFGTHMSVTFNGELLAVAMSAQHNAEQAEVFSAAASSSASAATTQADAALGYSNTANAAAATATAQAGIATTKAGESAASAVQASKLNLGDKSAPPTTDNQGQPLRAGATYFDTTLSKWRVWTGTAWGDGISAVAGVSSLNGETGPLVKTTLAGYGITDVRTSAYAPADAVPRGYGPSGFFRLQAGNADIPPGFNYSDMFASAALDTFAHVAVEHNTGRIAVRSGANQTVNAPWNRISQHSEFPVGLSGGAIDCALGNTFTETVSANRTLAFTNIPTGAYSCVLEINHTAGAITFPAGTVWAGTAPTLTAGKRHLFFFQRCQLGTAGWYVSALPGYST